MEEYDLLDGRCAACLSFNQCVYRYALLSIAMFNRPGAFKIWYIALDSRLLLSNVDSSNSRSVSKRAHRDS